MFLGSILFISETTQQWLEERYVLKNYTQKKERLTNVTTGKISVKYI
jgi:hypothetical protein